MRLRMTAWLSAALVLSFGAMVYECLMVDFSPQGRYVLLAVVALTLICCQALEVAGGVRWRGKVRLGLVAYFSFAACWSLWLLWENPCAPQSPRLRPGLRPNPLLSGDRPRRRLGNYTNH